MAIGLLVGPAVVAAGSDCPPEADAPVSRIASSWDALYLHFERYGHCDDGAVAEGFSEAVLTLLTGSWSELPRLAELVRKDDRFRSFVMKHVDDMMGYDTLRLVRSNAKTKCPRQLNELCVQVATAADRAFRNEAPKK